MKKLKTLGTALLAAAVILPGLAGCVVGGVPTAPDTEEQQSTPKVNSISLNKTSAEISIGQELEITATVNKTGEISDEVTWSFTTEGIATIVSQTGKAVTIVGVAEGSTYLKATSKGDGEVTKSIKITVIKPAVSSVEASVDNLTLGLNEESNVTVNLQTVGVATNLNKVTWSVEDTNVATIVSQSDTQVTVKGLAIGTTKLIVTSVYDNTKKDEVNIAVVNKGFAPQVYDEGFTYVSSGYATDAVKAFLGNDSANVFLPLEAAYANGSYYKVSEETDESYASISVITYSLAQSEDIYDAEMAHFEQPGAGYTHYFDSSTYNDFIVSNDGLSVVIFSYLEIGTAEDYSDFDALLMYTYLKATDVFTGSNTVTQDNEWDEEIETFFDNAFGEGVAVPFMALGEDYEVLYALDDPNYGTYFQLYDGSIDPTLGEAVKTDLVANQGFTYDENNLVFTKPIDDINSLNISVEFGLGAGNFIDVSVAPTVFTTFQETYIDNFVSTKLGTQWEIIPFEATSRTREGTTVGPEYRVELGNEDGIGDYIRTSGLFMNATNFAELIESYETAGFTLLYLEEPNAEEWVDGYAVLQKGKLMVQLGLYGEMVFDDSGMSFGFDNGTIELIAYTIDGLNDNFWLDIDTVNLGVGDDPVTVTAAFAGLDPIPEITWTSSDTDVATVANGVITPVAKGEATVSATAKVNGSDVTLTVDVTVETVAIYEEIYFSEYQSASFTSECGIKIAAAQESGSSTPAYFASASELRLYAKNTLTITAPEGHTITGILFYDSDDYGNKTEATVSANKGSYSDYLWTGEETSVTFTVGASGQFRIKGIVVCLDGDPADIGEGGGGSQDDEGESFLQDLICLLFEQDTAEYGVDYGYDDGYFTNFQIDDLVEDVDDVYAVLSQYYDCTQPEEDDQGFYGFYCVSDDGNYIADIYSVEDSSNPGTYYLEIDVYSMSDF